MSCAALACIDGHRVCGPRELSRICLHLSPADLLSNVIGNVSEFRVLSWFRGSVVIVGAATFVLTYLENRRPDSMIDLLQGSGKTGRHLKMFKRR